MQNKLYFALIHCLYKIEILSITIENINVIHSISSYLKLHQSVYLKLHQSFKL